MFSLSQKPSNRQTLFILLSLFSLCQACEPKRKIELKEGSPNPDALIDSSYFYVEDFDRLVEQYESPNREDWQNPDLVISKFGDLEGKTVADIGAGTGYFSFRLAEKARKVIAIDIDPRFLKYIEERKQASGNNGNVAKVITRLAEEHNPLLQKGEVDVALLVNTYYFLTERAQYMSKVAEGLTAQGKVIIVDYKSGNAPVGPPEEVKVPPGEVISELQASGFTDISVDTLSLEFQYIIVGQ